MKWLALIALFSIAWDMPMPDAHMPGGQSGIGQCTFSSGVSGFIMVCPNLEATSGLGVGTLPPSAAGQLQVNNSEGIGIAPQGIAGTLKLSESIGVNTAPAAVAGSVSIAGNSGSFNCTSGGGSNVACLKMNIGSGLFQEIGLNSSNQIVIGNSSTGPTTLIEAGVGNHLSFLTNVATMEDMTTSTLQFESGSASGMEVTNNTVFSIDQTTATQPSITAGCNGAGSGIDALCNDNTCYVTTQTAAATTCTVTFAVGFPNGIVANPHCTCSDANPNSAGIPCTIDTTNTTTASVKFNFPSVNNWIFAYTCV